MIIRKFVPDDLEAVIAIFCDSIRAIASRYYDPIQIEAWESPNAIKQELWLQNLLGNITYVAEDGKILSGFGDMTHQGYIDHLFVQKKYQGSGSAQRIFRKLEEEARKLNLQELTTEASIVAMPVAKRLGFEILEKQIKIHNGIEFTNYRMRKNLLT